jgi:hypothetical protein
MEGCLLSFIFIHLVCAEEVLQAGLPMHQGREARNRLCTNQTALTTGRQNGQSWTSIFMIPVINYRSLDP